MVLMVWVAPACRARASFASSRSTAMVCAPRKPEAAMAPSPTPPQPKMATASCAVMRPSAHRVEANR